MRFDVITLFPEMFEPFLRSGVTRRAYESGQVQVRLWPLREFTQDTYQRVDDRPFGGGPGMVMLAQPLCDAVQAIRQSRGDDGAPVVFFSPQGQTFEHASAQAWANSAGAILVCGRYEGVDQRFIDALVDVQISLGDFVLSGGELAAMVMLDAVTRLQPGVLGDQDSHHQDSFNPSLDGLLDCPHYTRPEVWESPSGPVGVPEVLMSGHHQRVAAFRRQASLAATAAARPDLLDAAREHGLLKPSDEAYLRDLGS
jgi:tRNA (guanine37-N1)-methyltransferase